jgi:hypothetical protein
MQWDVMWRNDYRISSNKSEQKWRICKLLFRNTTKRGCFKDKQFVCPGGVATEETGAMGREIESHQGMGGSLKHYFYETIHSF